MDESHQNKKVLTWYSEARMIHFKKGLWQNLNGDLNPILRFLQNAWRLQKLCWMLESGRRGLLNQPQSFAKGFTQQTTCLKQDNESANKCKKYSCWISVQHDKNFKKLNSRVTTYSWKSEGIPEIQELAHDSRQTLSLQWNSTTKVRWILVHQE